MKKKSLLLLNMSTNLKRDINDLSKKREKNSQVNYFDYILNNFLI